MSERDDTIDAAIVLLGDSRADRSGDERVRVTATRRVLVCGSRSFGECVADRAFLDQELSMLSFDVTIVHGDAKGADRHAGRWADTNGRRVEAHPADWVRHGRAAGPIRNAAMLASGIDLVIAFWDGTSRGTQDMINKSKTAGVPTHVYYFRTNSAPSSSPMRKRSEVSKKPSTTTDKPSAAERTVPLEEAVKKSDQDKTAKCVGCSESFDLGLATRNTTGFAECPRCAMPHTPTIGGPVRQSNETICDVDGCGEVQLMSPSGVTCKNGHGGAPAKERSKATQPLPKAYCNKCGAEWLRVDGRPFPNCGHDDGFVDDPTKAEEWKPPAGLPQPPDGMRGKNKRIPTQTPAVSATEADGLVHLRVEWGKITFSMGSYQNMTVGPFSISANIPPSDDLPSLARIQLKELREMADASFAEQVAWFEEKLNELSRKG